MARQHHYLFAYMALPDFAFRDGDRFFRFRAPIAKGFLEAIWDLAGNSVKEKLPPDGLEMSVEKLPCGQAAVLVQLPEPVEPPEAYFAAFVKNENGTTHYFTLERSVSLTEKEELYTVLGGVDLSDGKFQHINFGAGPAPDRQAFIEAVDRLLNATVA